MADVKDVVTEAAAVAVVPAAVNCVTSIDGYVFRGVPYEQAVAAWLRLYNAPGYVPARLLKSVSVDVTFTVA